MVEAFWDESGVIAQVVTAMTVDLTGSLFVSYLVIMIFLFFFALMFRIPIEYTAILYFPWLVVVTSFNSDFLGVFGAFVIYIGIIVAKNFFISSR